MNQKRTDGPNMTFPHQHPTTKTQTNKLSLDEITFDDTTRSKNSLPYP